MRGSDFDRSNYEVYRTVAVFTNDKKQMRRIAIYSLAMSVHGAEEKALMVKGDSYTIVRTNRVGSYKSWKTISGSTPRNAELEPPLVVAIE